MFLDEDKAGKSPKVKESRAMFFIAMTAICACIAMVVSLMSPPAVAVDRISTSAIQKTGTISSSVSGTAVTPTQK